MKPRDSTLRLLVSGHSSSNATPLPLAELPDPGETAPTRWPRQEAPEHQLSPTQPVEQDRRRHRRSGELRAQSSTSHHFPAITSPRHSTHPTILIFDPLTVQFPSKPGDPLPRQCNIAAWEEAASNVAAKSAGSDDKRPVKQNLDRACPKNETSSNTFSNDSRPVPPKGSVLLQHCGTKRSVAVQTADSVEHEDSLWDWLTTSTTTTAATQTSAPEALQQWCFIQQKYWMELQRLQRRMQRTLDQIRDPSQQLPSRP